MKSLTEFANRYYPIVVVLVLFTCASCSKKMYLNGSTVVPAADGIIKYKKGNNNNYTIDVKILHLADPTKLVPPKDYYVLWMETERNGTKNLGQIVSSDSWLSNTLKASLTTVTAFKPVRFFITAEDAANISYPGNQIVLSSQ